LKKKPYLTGYIKYITDKEFKEIRHYVNTEILSPPMRMIIKTVMYLGLRAGEACELKRENFNKDFSLLTFQVKKTNQIKQRKLQRFLSMLFRSYNQNYKSYMREDYLFYPYRNKSKYKHIQRNSVSAKFAHIRKALGYDHVYYTCKDGKKLYRVSSHTLRHYAIYRYYIASGKDIIATQQIIGHKKIETTSKYIRSLEAMNKEQQIIEKAFTF